MASAPTWGLQSRRLARRVETIREGKRPRLLKGKSINCLILTCPPLIVKLSMEQSEAGYPHTDLGSKVNDLRASHVPKNSKLALRVTFGKRPNTDLIDQCASTRLFLNSKIPQNILHQSTGVLYFLQCHLVLRCFWENYSSTPKNFSV